MKFETKRITAILTALMVAFLYVSLTHAKVVDNVPPVGVWLFEEVVYRTLENERPDPPRPVTQQSRFKSIDFVTFLKIPKWVLKKARNPF